MHGGRRGVPRGGGLGVMLLVVVLGSLALTGATGSGQTSLATTPAGPPDRCDPAWVTAWQASPQPVPPAERLTGRTGSGDFSLHTDGAAFTTPVESWMVLTGVDVLAPRPVNALVAMGDSITDGVGSGLDTDSRWSDALSDRLARRGGATTMAVLNAGISRNELLADRGHQGGDSPLSRFEWEVADVPGATDVVLHIGTNDIAVGRSGSEVVDGLVRFTGLARAAGKRVFLTTITPSDAGPHGTSRAATARDEVNRWVRERGAQYADGVFDFASAVADPARPGRLLARYDSGDGLHLSEAGYRALADAVDVTRLSGSPCLAERSPTRVALSGG